MKFEELSNFEGIKPEVFSSQASRISKAVEYMMDIVRRLITVWTGIVYLTTFYTAEV